MVQRQQWRRGETVKTCACEHFKMHHRPAGGGCYACSCDSFAPSVKTSHRYQIRGKSTEYNGRAYKSQAEAKYAEQLDWRLKAGEITSWSYEPRVEIGFHGVWILDWRPDFEVFYPDGMREIVEIKGYIADSREFRLKWKLTEALYNADPKTRCLLIKV